MSIKHAIYGSTEGLHTLNVTFLVWENTSFKTILLHERHANIAEPVE